MQSTHGSHNLQAGNIGRAYAEGAGLYEVDEKAKKEIDEINKKIYDKSDKKINDIYDWGFKVTMEAFEDLYKTLSSQYELKVLSGDNEGERETLARILPPGTELIFDQKPDQKLEFIKNLQSQGKNVMMVGDGLNDAGALAQSNVGISISENVNVFSPACDGILEANEFDQLYYFLKLSKKGITTIKMSFTLSLLYNVVGLSFAITGHLLPLVAAIIMPLSTITIVSFVTVMSNFYAKKLGSLRLFVRS